METIQIQESKMQSCKIEAVKIDGYDILEKRLAEHLSDSTGTVREMCTYTMNAGGKRIRPQLVLHCGLIFSHTKDELLDTAVSAELIHMASLVHDDIIDKSPVRRNRQSVNKRWDNHYAVLCGDYLFAKAFSILADQKLSVPLKLMVDSIQNMCVGEIEQAGDKFNIEMGFDRYYDRIAKKTAIFIMNCCKAGAFVGGANQCEISLVGDYGLNLGLAFQIIDDILDFSGDADKIGKPVGEDLSQGNITLPVLLVMKDRKYGNRLNEMLLKDGITAETIPVVTQFLYESGAIGDSFKVAGSFINKAKECLRELPKTSHTGFLAEMADILESRMN